MQSKKAGEMPTRGVKTKEYANERYPIPQYGPNENRPPISGGKTTNKCQQRLR